MNRYPEYEDSGVEWIGKIPVHWNLSRINSLFFRRKEKNTNIISDNILSVLKDRGVIRYEDKGNIGNKVSERIDNYQLVYPGDLVINNMNVTIGSVGTSDQFGALSGIYIVLASKRADVSMAYYNYLFKIKPFQKSLIQISSGLMKIREALNFIEFKVLKLPTPPLPEQHAIANFLDHKTQQIDELVRVKERKIELLGEYRASLIQQAVTKGLDPDVEMKQSGVEWIGEIPKHWAISKVKHELESLDHLRVPLNSETRGSMKSKVYDYYGASGVIDEVEAYIFDESLILIGEDGANLYLRSTPLAFKATGKYWVNNHAHVLRPRHGNIDYLTNMLESLDYTHYISGAAQPKLTAGRLMNITVVIPPLSEQNQIANFLDHKTRQIDELRSNEEQTIKLLKEYRQSLISAVVTGKIDVRNEV